MTKTIKIIATSLGIICLLFFSLKLERLDKFKSAHSENEFDADAYALRFWEEVLPQKTANAAELTEVLDLLDENPSEAFSKYSETLGISKTHYFLLKGEGIIESIGEEFLILTIANENKVKIATDFIYGNAIRDGSGGVNISEFLNMTDFNMVSISINKIVKEQVIPQLTSSSTPGGKIKFVGATEISENNIDLESVLIIPVEVKMMPAKNE